MLAYRIGSGRYNHLSKACLRLPLSPSKPRKGWFEAHSQPVNRSDSVRTVLVVLMTCAYTFPVAYNLSRTDARK